MTELNRGRSERIYPPRRGRKDIPNQIFLCQLERFANPKECTEHRARTVFLHEPSPVAGDDKNTDDICL